jgi:hypothetical protein
MGSVEVSGRVGVRIDDLEDRVVANAFSDAPGEELTKIEPVWGNVIFLRVFF